MWGSIWEMVGTYTALAVTMAAMALASTALILLMVIPWPATTERNYAGRGGLLAAMTGAPCPESKTGHQALACRCVH